MIIYVSSNPDLDPLSTFHGLPATQRQIDYKITVNGQQFIFPNVWALQTLEKSEDGEEKPETYFNPDVGKTISDAIFRQLHPKETLINNIMNGRVEPPL